MTKPNVRGSQGVMLWTAVLVLSMLTPALVRAQNFDFKRLEEKVQVFTAVIDMKLEISFGIHTSEQQERYLGTIVTEDGLVIFNGAALAVDNAFSPFAGFMIKTTPTKIEITTFDGEKYEGEYIGVDQFTRIGFIRIITQPKKRFTPVRFQDTKHFRTGEWLTLYMLLPEFLNPPLAADVGMVSSLVKSPENFPLTVGFNPLQLTSVLFDENLEPVGVLGSLIDASQVDPETSGPLESFAQFGVPLLGVISSERLEKLIAAPPQRGEIDHGWLGITIQALTPEIARFWNLDLASGIIVNEIIPNSPAEKANLAVGDIIFEVNSQQIEVDKDEKLPSFQRLIAEMGPGVSAELSVIRRSAQTTDTLMLFTTLEKAPLAASEAPAYEIKSLEFKVRNLVFADYMFYNLDPETFEGVVVSELKQGGLANISGLQLGDIIQRIDNHAVASVDDAKSVMEEVKLDNPREVIFFVWRNNKTLFVNVKTDWK